VKLFEIPRYDSYLSFYDSRPFFCEILIAVSEQQYCRNVISLLLSLILFATDFKRIGKMFEDFIGQTVSLDLSDLPKGSYVVSTSDKAGKSLMRKVTKQ
jgi:hypothetical protein